MRIQIDGAIKPAGLVSGAKRYSVILDEETVYLIHVGPASTNIKTYNPLEQILNDFLGKRAAEKVAAGEARLAEMGAVALATERHSAALTAEDVRRVAISQMGSSLILTIRSGKGNYKLLFKREVLEEVEQIVVALS